MAIEIERKFLIDPALLPKLPAPFVITQGYIPAEGVTVRVRTKNAKAFLTLKGKREGIVRSEFEYEVPVDDAFAMLQELCPAPLIEKKRYEILYEGHLWEVDIFEGENAGLYLAEIELESADETFALPPWVTREVTDDRRYYNSNLRTLPYVRFKNEA
ncbi:CYTH domain-containing protein [Sulfurimonas sp. HSL1-6]|uniref:CYTH domain-containing protein n=1 Tax=Thiomicrolovo immobilis TaxID=3131935 RepID=UPI0031F9D5E3